MAANSTISVVTPTRKRPAEVVGLLENLAAQSVTPAEVIIVDGSEETEYQTEARVKAAQCGLPFRCVYMRHKNGTAIQRNAGIERARANLIAFVDDDIRLEPDFFERIVRCFKEDAAGVIAGITGYRANQNFELQQSERWRWYRRLALLKTFEPGRYDYSTGYPINANLQPPFSGVREVDFMTSSCSVWRREVFDFGLRFDPFFSEYGILEDAHFSLRARRSWTLLQCGDARCVHLNSPAARENRRKIGYKCVVNYYYVFRDVVQPLTWKHQLRFWRFQLFELVRIGASAVRRARKGDISDLRGRLEGFIAVARGLKTD